MKMTENNQKQSGKYNSNKEWGDEGKTGKEFVSAADGMAYVNKKKYAIMDKMETVEQEPVEEEVTEETVLKEEAKPFQKIDYKKRYDDLKRHYDKRVNEFKEKEVELREQIRSNRPTYTPPKSQEELSKFAEENPDIYQVVESVSHLRASEQMKELEEELKEVKERLMYEEAKRAYVELKTLVPDYEEIKTDQNFHEWAEQQPKEIQDWIYNNRTNVQLAVKAINLYKADRGIGQKPPKVTSQSDRRGTADQSVGVNSRKDEPQSREKIWSRAEIGALSLQQYEKLREEIDRAFAEGRVTN